MLSEKSKYLFEVLKKLLERKKQEASNFLLSLPAYFKINPEQGSSAGLPAFDCPVQLIDKSRKAG